MRVHSETQIFIMCHVTDTQFAGSRHKSVDTMIWLNIVGITALLVYGVSLASLLVHLTTLFQDKVAPMLN